MQKQRKNEENTEEIVNSEDEEDGPIAKVIDSEK